MTKPSDIATQVLTNCDISDAAHAGLFSICGLALRLRDLFKWEKKLDPWEERESSEVLEWIGEKEQIWESIANEEFNPIYIGDESFDPFDIRGINESLEPRGLYYGAGYAGNVKPTFFLGEINKTETVEDCTVITIGEEYARDLLTLPALCEDDRIILREHSAALYLWDEILYIKPSGKKALEFALNDCGITDHRPESLIRHMSAILKVQKDIYIFHELGEIRDTGFNRDIWREMVAGYPDSPVELYARAVKDLLADTSPAGTLRHIITARNTAALGFYAAFIENMNKSLFPEFIDAFSGFMETSEWSAVEIVVEKKYADTVQLAQTMSDIHIQGKKGSDAGKTVKKIEALFHLIDRKE